MNFTLFNFDFIKIEQIDNIKHFYNDLAFSQPNSYLNDIGIPSGSTYINLSKLLLSILWIAFTHGLFLIIFNYYKCKNRNRVCIWIYNTMFSIYSFSIYIRLIIEAYLMMLLSCFSEIYELNNSNKITMASFYINIVILVIVTAVLVIWIWQISKAHPTYNPIKQKYFVEFFGGLRNTTYSRIISAVFLVQRILSWIVVIFLANFNLTIKLSILTIIQASHLMYLLIVRPYEDRKDFLLEWISQFIVVFFSAILSKFNSKNDWNSFLNWTLIIAIMVWALISNTIL